MQTQVLAMVLAMVLGATSMVHFVVGTGEPSAPDCVPKCWANSKFVSTCTNETKCFCEDGGFQSAVYQCLYSQCQTAQFGSALHYALSECSVYNAGDATISPPLMRHDYLRKRQNYQAGYGSGHASGSAVHSIYRRKGPASASAYSRPTRSAAQDTVYSPYSGDSQTTAFQTPSATASVNGTGQYLNSIITTTPVVTLVNAF
ncbi:MAG: hypothetical protein M1830_008717 [Pleopsidium flavum]|nr:MAG: hypothetical protein M1830_008717 [Pleopsidium flavum]